MSAAYGAITPSADDKALLVQDVTFQKAEDNEGLMLSGGKPRSGLKKDSLGFLSLFAFSVTMICPSTSVLLTSGLISSQAGLSAPFVIILSALMNLCLANTVRQFSKYISSAGSFYSFVSAGLGTGAGFLCAWALLFSYGVLNVQVLLEMGAWVSDIIHANTQLYIPWYVIVVIECSIIGTLAWVGIKNSVRVSLFLLSFETIVIVIFSFIIIGKGGADGHNSPIALTPFASPNGMDGIFKGLLFGTLSFMGFDSASTLSEEAKDSKKTVGNAIVASIIVTASYMVLGTYAMVVAVGEAEATNLRLIPSAADVIARRFISPGFAVLIDLAGVTATYTVTAANFNTNYRILYSMGREKLLGLGIFGKTDQKRQTPVYAIVIFTILCFILSLGACAISGGFATAERSAPAWKAYGALSFIATLELLLIYVGSNVALYVFMTKQHPKDYRPWKHLYLPAFTFVMFCLPLGGNFIPTMPEAPQDWLSIVWVFYNVLGVAVLYYLRRFRPEMLANMGRVFS